MTTGGQQSWGVVCTAAEPAALCVAFAAHHLAMGAARVWMYLDRPDPETAALLSELPGCEVQACDRDYWRAPPGGRRPRVVTRRQLANAEHALARAEVDWLLHLDCDEFLRADYPLATALSALPGDTTCAVFRPAERVTLRAVPQVGLFDGIFRRPAPHPGRRHTPEGEERMAWRGMTGHSFGKSATRVGTPVLMGIHTPRPRDRSQPWRPVERDVPGVTLLHFDGLTARHWQHKLQRVAADAQNLEFLRRHDSGRHAQVCHLRDAEDPARAAEDLHRRLKTLDDAGLARLVREGRIDTRPFDPVPALTRFGMDGRIDLSAAAFDGALPPPAGAASRGAA